MSRAVLFAVWVLCVPVAAADEPKSKAPDWKPLFDGKTLDGWKPSFTDNSGKVHVKDGAIVLDKGMKMTGVTYAGKDFPKSDYEVVLEGKRVDGRDFFATTTFPVGDGYCSLVVGGWGGPLVGISSVNGADASENETTGSVEFKDNPGTRSASESPRRSSNAGSGTRRWWTWTGRGGSSPPGSSATSASRSGSPRTTRSARSATSRSASSRTRRRRGRPKSVVRAHGERGFAKTGEPPASAGGYRPSVWPGRTAQPLDDFDPVPVGVGDEEAVAAGDRDRLVDPVPERRLRPGRVDVRDVQAEVPRADGVPLRLQEQVQIRPPRSYQRTTKSNVFGAGISRRPRTSP